MDIRPLSYDYLCPSSNSESMAPVCQPCRSDLDQIVACLTDASLTRASLSVIFVHLRFHAIEQAQPILLCLQWNTIPEQLALLSSLLS